jgi:3-oxoacyl-[acyl-carrier protein] reductase
MELQGAKALVTGGSEGIGKAIAAALRAEGAEVAITGRRKELLERSAAELDLWALPGDVSVEADAVATVEAFVARHGRIDVLVNNAGFGHFAPLVEMDRERFDAVFATNVTGAMLMAREAARHFVRQRSGHLVNISSTSGLKGGAGGSAYSASKFALRGMTECWREELRRHDVRVMLINPSEVLTEFSSHAGYTQQQSEKKLRAKEIADAVLGVLRMDDRGFVPELTVFATNPF